MAKPAQNVSRASLESQAWAWPLKIKVYEDEDEENVSVGMVIPGVLHFHSPFLVSCSTVTGSDSDLEKDVQCSAAMFWVLFQTSDISNAQVQPERRVFPWFWGKVTPQNRNFLDFNLFSGAGSLASFSISLFVGLCCSLGMNLILPGGDRILFYKCQASKGWNLAFKPP